MAASLVQAVGSAIIYYAAAAALDKVGVKNRLSALMAR